MVERSMCWRFRYSCDLEFQILGRFIDLYNLCVGGPLVNMEQNLLIGVVSFGSANCGGFSGTPDGHTRVSNFTTWIQERIKIY